MERITDWKGHEIKPGMEIVFITTVERHLYRMGFINFKTGEDYLEPLRPDKAVWWPSEPHKVELDQLGRLGYEVRGEYGPGEYEGWTYSGFILLSPSLLEDRLLAIKGISDQNPAVTI